MRVSTRKRFITPKTIMRTILTESEIQKIRGELYSQIKKYPDMTMDLLDALCSKNHEPSVAHLSLNAKFRGSYSSMYKVIGKFASKEEGAAGGETANLVKVKKIEYLETIAKAVPRPEQRPFYLFGIDCTSKERQYAKTLADRGMVYKPTQLKGNKPITIGHNYSMLAVLPERSEDDAPWTIPLDMSRVSTESTGREMGINQLKAVLSNPHVPWHNRLCVTAVDSAYGNKQFLVPLQEHKNSVIIARVASSRVFYQSPVPEQTPAGKGHPTWYGAKFELKNPDTHPNQVLHSSYVNRRGKTIHLTITAWSNLLMRGSKEHPAHKFPFTLLRIERSSENTILPPMWLMVIGECRDELSLLQIYQAYCQRFDLEHTFRFSKQNLLLNAFQTPDVIHEERWVKMVMLAYVQLWMAHSLAISLPRPWEKGLKVVPSARISPSKVQQDWFRIISHLGTPAVPPKPRGFSSGRKSGQTQSPRPPLPVIKKGKSKIHKPAVAA